jgi:predicted nucleic acid-binding protein
MHLRFLRSIRSLVARFGPWDTQADTRETSIRNRRDTFGQQVRFDYVRLFANLLDVVPAGDEDEQQIVLKAVAYFEDGMTPFDAFHAATAETRELPILSSDKAYEGVDPDRIPLEPTTDE